MSTVEEETLRGFLLGTLPESRREDLEARILEDHELFELLRATEDDLIDDFVGGRLSHEEHAAFESSPLASARNRPRLGFARALSDVARDAQQTIQPGERDRGRLLPFSLRPSGPVLQGLAAAALVGLVASGAWLLWSRDLEPTREAAPATATRTITVDLFPISLRGPGEAPSAVLSPDIGALRLRLALPDGLAAPTLGAVLATPSTEIRRWDELHPDRLPSGPMLELTVSADQVSSGPHELVLSDPGPSTRVVARYRLVIQTTD